MVVKVTDPQAQKKLLSAYRVEPLFDLYRGELAYWRSQKGGGPDYFISNRHFYYDPAVVSEWLKKKQKLISVKA
jgi:hypothetical protein